MSYATDMLAKSQAAYAAAMTAFERVRSSEREMYQRNLDELLRHVQYWEGMVSAETARTNGRSGRRPIQVVL